MPRARIPSHFFVFVVVEHEGRVLLVREAKHGQLWYCPAGGLEAGEGIREAAVRETMEEAGVLIEPTGLLRVDQQWFPSDGAGGGLVAWWRFVVRARPARGARVTPKMYADHHSLEARWVAPEAVADYALRHHEVIELVSLALRDDVQAVPLVA